MDKTNSKQKPLVGILPGAGNLAETGRAVLIGKRLRDMGVGVIFFSHGGKYEFLIEDNDFEIVRVKPFVTEEQVKEALKMFAIETLKAKTVLTEDWLLENVEEEIAAFKKTGIKVLVSTNCAMASLSARAAKVLYINISPGPGNFAIKIYDAFENPLTFLIPQFIKIPILKYLLNGTKWYLKPINKVAKKVGAPEIERILHIFRGDITIKTNYIEFVNVFPNQYFGPPENYVGIILLDELFVGRTPKEEIKKIDSEIEAHLKRPGKSILVTLG
ncbi:MAG: hypothetical protein JSW62_03325, partial [Thermoplasmatales archaeon]